MRDEVKDYPTDPNAQKSVSDWLMHVISGKPPLEGQPDGAAQATAPQVAGAIAVVEELPSERERTKGAAEKKNAMTTGDFTAEDLCGPAVFKMTASAPVKEEITADDLCFVPKSEETKPHRNGTSAVAESTEHLRNHLPVAEATQEKKGAESNQIHEPEQNRAAEVIEIKQAEKRAAGEVIEAARPPQEPPKKEVAAKDAGPHAAAEVVEEKKPEQSISSFILRDRLPNARAPQEVTNFSRRTMAAATTGEHEVTVADILRERVLRQMSPAVEPIAPKTQPVAAEAEATAAVDVSKKEELKEELPIEQARGAQTAVESHSSLPQMQELKAAPEPIATGVESAGKPEAAAKALPSAEPQVVEVAGAAEQLSVGAKAESVAGAADGAKSMFAQEGIWGDAARVDTAPREEEASFSDADPMYQASKRGYLKPEELQELEHAMEEEKPENLSSALKTLVRLGSVLPWISRAAPGAEGGPGSEMETGLSHEGRHEIANLRMIQYEIRSTVHDHSLQLKRMEELMIRVRESMESDTRESMDLAESMKSTAKLLRLVGIGLGVLMVVLIVMVGMGLGHK